MTKESLAAMLDGRKFGEEISRDEEQLAKQSGLFVIFGYSDDNVEIRGVDHDEIGAFEGTTFRLGMSGFLQDWDGIDHDDMEECRKFFKNEASGKKIEACWCDGDVAWTFKTDIPHCTFKIMDEGEPFCIGIVIDMKDLA